MKVHWKIMIEETIKLMVFKLTHDDQYALIDDDI